MDIGEERKVVEFEPLEAPAQEPTQEPAAPSEPVREEEPVPANA